MTGLTRPDLAAHTDTCTPQSNTKRPAPDANCPVPNAQCLTPIANVPATLTYSSSLRVAGIETTLAHASRLLDRLGISRVTDITRLDRVGVPVFASIRPGARHGSLCVNAGKGLTVEEARVGATMEAIEFALAEYGASCIQVVAATARDVLDGHVRPEAVLDFCPLMGREIPLDAPLMCVEAEELVAGGRCLIPAELVFLPTPTDVIPRRYFGSHSNGLASGNSLLEATVHGLAEVIERDIMSFHSLRDTSIRVLPETFPPEARCLAEQIDAAGLQLAVRYEPNIYDIAWFEAAVVDPDLRSHLYVNNGVGCHPHARIALVRAICEALQSRLSFIHGGRDDLINRYRRCETWTEAALANHVEQLIAQVSRHDPSMTFDEAPDCASEAVDVVGAYRTLEERVLNAGMERICRVAYTSPEEPLQVVRIVVPKAEFFQEISRRIGVRLREFIREL